MELKPGQYQGGLKMLTAADAALQQAMSSVRRREEPPTLRRRIEDVEGFLKKAKRELNLA
ncbi:MAG: hypothetical protein ACE5EO_12140 [Candidatus Krumholzibacteriia bacterium]